MIRPLPERERETPQMAEADQARDVSKGAADGNAGGRFYGDAGGRLSVPWLACSALSGVLLFLAFPPADLWPLAFVALVPLLIALDRAPSSRAALLYGSVAAAAAYLPSFAWVASVSVPGWLVLAFYVGLYVAVAAPVFRFLQRNQRVLWPLLAAFLWTGLELVRAELGPGFPWLFLGYTQYRFSGLLQLAALGGVYAVSFVVFLVNASVAALVAAVLRGPSGAARTFPAGHCLMLAFSAALTIACAGAGYAVRDGIAMREGPVVGIVQQNIPRLVAEIFDERKTMEDVYRERESEVQVAAQLTAGLRERGVRLIVWPETTVPLPLDVPSEMFVQDRERLLQERILSYLRQLGSDMDCWFLIGAPSCLARSVTRPGSLLYGVEAREEFGNSAVFLSPQAEYVDRYDKMRLVPFGEYIPLRDVLPFLSAFTPIPRELTPGEEEVIFSLPPGEGNEPVRFGALICYEDVFADLTRSFRRKGADFLVNLTDEGWYPIPGELGQHLPMAVFRAVETRTTVVRAANTGISCFINPVGEVYERLEPWTEGALSAPLQLCDVVTPYVQYGDAFGLMCLVLAFALLAVLARSSRKRRR